MPPLTIRGTDRRAASSSPTSASTAANAPAASPFRAAMSLANVSVVNVQPPGRQPRRARDQAIQFDGARAWRDAAAVHADVQVEQDFDLRAGRRHGRREAPTAPRSSATAENRVVG